MTRSSSGRWVSSSVSTSSSRNRAAILRPSRIATSSSTTSATRRPSPSRSAVRRLTVLAGPAAGVSRFGRKREGDRRLPWAVAWKPPRTSTPPGPASFRRSCCGSFTVQPSLVRWRRLTPQRVSRRSSVSRYVADTLRSGSVSANTPSLTPSNAGRRNEGACSELDFELGHDRARHQQGHARLRAPAGARGHLPRSWSSPCAIRRVGAPRRARRPRG